MKQIALVISFVSVFFIVNACKLFEPHYELHVYMENHSQEDYCWQIPSRFKPVKVGEPPYQPWNVVPSGKSNHQSVERDATPSRPGYERWYESFIGDSVSVYIYDMHAKYAPKWDLETHKRYLRFRYDLSVEDLEQLRLNHNGTIMLTFPPSEEMKDMNMTPSYEEIQQMIENGEIKLVENEDPK